MDIRAETVEVLKNEINDIITENLRADKMYSHEPDICKFGRWEQAKALISKSIDKNIAGFKK